MQLQIHNLKRLQTQLKNDIQNCQNIQNIISTIDKKVSHQGIERINKVALRQVEIKHTSQFTVHLGCQFYAQLKTNEAIQFIKRKKIKYSDDLKKVQAQLQVVDKQYQKNKKTHQLNKQVNQKFSSTMQIVGKNQMGEDIFNIIEMEGEQDEDIAKWGTNNKNPVETLKNGQTKTTQLKVIQQEPKKEIRSNQIEQDSDQNMEDNKISDSDDQEQDYDNGQEDLLHFDRLRLEDQLNVESLKDDPQMIKTFKIQQQHKTTQKQTIQSNSQNLSFQKSQIKEKPRQQEPQKKISKFKMQRMKQRQ